MRDNPFYELYLSDSMPAKEFVTLFSDKLLPHAQLLFKPGNVVITGMMGSGKSMLLKLLQFETRLMYLTETKEFPIPAESRNFISCNINLAHSSAIDFGNRRWSNTEPSDVESMFADYFNVVLVLDLLSSVQSYSQTKYEVLKREAGVSATPEGLDDLAKSLTKSEFWHGWLEGTLDFEGLKERLSRRIKLYRSFLHRREDSLPAELLSTRTSVGEPIGELVNSLRQLGIIELKTNVFADVDQYEELGNIAVGNSLGQKIDYRSVINRALSRRDSRVSYRIGARGHSWRSHMGIMGSTGKLEEERDYKYINLDALLTQSENSKTYIYPSFAEDIFDRRMKSAGYAFNKSKKPMVSVYQESLDADQKAKLYNSEGSEKAIALENNWKQSTKDRLRILAKNEPLSARLGEAWIRQKGEAFDLQQNDSNLPWRHKKWWLKERIEIAQLQIASRNQQRPIYSGRDEIIRLSGGNILTFISINQHIWDEYFRYEARREKQGNEFAASTLPSIGKDIQSNGIFRTSEYWFKKIRDESGNSSERAAFVEELARFLREKLMGDKSLSYPGESGFSLEVSELAQFPKVELFLNETVDFGNLTDANHTTKEKSRSRRKKWYLSAIYCPFLGLPYQRIKEPRYSSLRELAEILNKADINILGRPASQQSQIKLL